MSTPTVNVRNIDRARAVRTVLGVVRADSVAITDVLHDTANDGRTNAVTALILALAEASATFASAAPDVEEQLVNILLDYAEQEAGQTVSQKLNIKGMHTDNLELLYEIKEVWPEGEPEIATTELIQRLAIHSPAKWSIASDTGKPLTSSRLGRALGTFNIYSENVGKKRGYYRNRFTELWAN